MAGCSELSPSLAARAVSLASPRTPAPAAAGRCAARRLSPPLPAESVARRSVLRRPVRLAPLHGRRLPWRLCAPGGPTDVATGARPAATIRPAQKVSLRMALRRLCSTPAAPPPSAALPPRRRPRCGDPSAVRSCQSNSCTRCADDIDCQGNERCCGGSCVPGDCCGAGDCCSRVCRQNQCQACSNSAQCGAGQMCCGGLCRAGDCCAASDCAPGQVCRGGTCRACSGNAECGPAAHCIQGSCVADAECGENLDCSDGMCMVSVRKTPHPRALGVSCAQSSDRGVAEVCCGNVCLSGECCTTR